MVRSSFRRRVLAICAVALGLTLVAGPASAQTGQVKGKVVDAQNKPIEGAKVTIVRKDGGNPKFEVRTKRGGEFIQVGIPAGDYVVAAEKEGLNLAYDVKVGFDMKEVNFTLKPGGAGGEMSKEEAAKEAARIAGIKTAFAEGATLSNAGKYDEAVAKFEAVLKDVPKCTECYVNIGSVKTLKKDYEGAEAAFKQALTVNPESVDAYNGLATLYNAQKKFKEAQEMSAEAAKRAPAGAGGGSADSFYNQGVIAWNANDFAKASEHFAAAVKADPNHAESHFMLGRAYLNLGKLPEAAEEFQTYVKIAPNGPNAKEAQTNVDALKPYIKK
jgi:tetratricopeptide (TPR) repeat protein